MRRCVLEGEVGGGGLPFWRIVPGNRDRKEEAGAGNCTHCPHATLLPWSPGGRRRGSARGASFFFVCTPSGAGGNKNTACLTVEVVKLSMKKNPTGDHLLGIVRFHVAVVLADTLRFPLLSRLLSVKWIRIVFKDDHLDLKKRREMATVYNLKDKDNRRK